MLPDVFLCCGTSVPPPESNQRAEEKKRWVFFPGMLFNSLAQMPASLLSKYARLNRWRVKRHLKQDVFKRLKPEILRRYADVFGITLEQLLEVPPDITHCFKGNAHPCK